MVPFPGILCATDTTPALLSGAPGIFLRVVSRQPELLASLRNAWFINWVLSTDYMKNMPDGMRYAPSVFVKQWKTKNNALVSVDWEAPYVEPYTYTISPPLKTIAQLAARYPGQLWLAGNEIERRDWRYQNQMDRADLLVNKRSALKFMPVFITRYARRLKQLILSEYGVNFPPDTITPEFEPDNINVDFLVPSLNYIMGETDPVLGYPADDDRLVQSVWWWSLDVDYGNYDGSTF